ncbi:hypothetical protein [uncultured Helicobacter sp.]|uniref:hypothetical protein n=1 Tax=uncultured Helicobacter sp. TaxID=175537 RepID=UPI003752F82A
MLQVPYDYISLAESESPLAPLREHTQNLERDCVFWYQRTKECAVGDVDSIDQSFYCSHCLAR